MKGFKQCKNGHFFKEDLNECPYCPGAGTASKKRGNDNFEQTRLDEDLGDNDRTLLDDQDLEKTKTMGGSGSGNYSGGTGNTEFDPNKTYVAVPESKDGDETNGSEKARSTKKIVGWLVSYTIDPMGRDYKLYEGRNTIGKGMNNSIMIGDDPTISTNHLTILYTNKNYYISDEMSGNGTKINGEFIRPKEAIDLKDDDSIEIGNTTLKFRTSF